jgi:hypothetical protein
VPGGNAANKKEYRRQCDDHFRDPELFMAALICGFLRTQLAQPPGVLGVGWVSN